MTNLDSAKRSPQFNATDWSKKGNLQFVSGKIESKLLKRIIPLHLALLLNYDFANGQAEGIEVIRERI